MAFACALVFKGAVFHPAVDGSSLDLDVQLDIYQGVGTPMIKVMHVHTNYAHKNHFIYVCNPKFASTSKTD